MTDKINVRLFCMAEEFLESVKKDEKYLAVFSDIEMDTMNGIELGKWLNKKRAQEKGKQFPSFLLHHMKSLRLKVTVWMHISIF